MKEYRSDSDILESLISSAENGVVIIPQRVSEYEPERKHWLIDRAILLRSDTTVILRNCKIKLSDKCRDNFFRSANCGLGIEDIKPAHNIHIIGEGYSSLEGADHPRATGDETKVLKYPCYNTKEDIVKYADWISDERRAKGEPNFWDYHLYTCGTDARNPDEKQTGDWRNIGILLALVDNFSIENIHIVESHGWGISLEACSHGHLSKIDFHAQMQRTIDGVLNNVENQDGIDLRNGCHDITVTDITGHTGDDLIALTAIATPSDDPKPSGIIDSTHIMHHDWSRRERDIYNIMIRGVIGRSQGGSAHGCCSMIRLLPAGTYIRNVIISDVINTHPDGLREGYTLLLGEGNNYGENFKDSMKNIVISNIVCDSIKAIGIRGHITDSVISNVINRNPECEAVTVFDGKYLGNVTISNTISAK